MQLSVCRRERVGVSQSAGRADRCEGRGRRERAVRGCGVKTQVVACCSAA